MGKPSAPVVGYHYRLAAHFILTPRKINGFLEFRGGTKTAWSGSVTESSTVQVDAPNLWGGEKDQGGIVTPMDFMFGDDDQLPNPYLVSVFGPQVCAWRGWTGVSLDGGRYGAMNPYAQKPSWKFWRTTAGWDNDACWYEEKCEIVAVAPKGGVYTFAGTSAHSTQGYNSSEASITLENGESVTVSIVFDSPGAFSRWSSDSEPPPGRKPWACYCYVSKDGGAPTEYFSGEYDTPEQANAAMLAAGPITLTGPGTFYIYLADGDTEAYNNRGSVTIGVGIVPGIFINPAHVLYETLTAEDMGREPVESVNDDSFRAAADKLYAEGFGICPSWDTGSESLDDFRERIEKLIAGSLNRSLEDGQWYLDLARGDYVLDDLPILTDDDILDFKVMPATLDNAINSVSVKWLDPQTKSRKTTAPVRALGLVRQFGTNHQVYDYPEIATEALALRVAQRELMATTTPTRAYDCAWKPGSVYKLRPNQYFRLQAPKRGIADMVCIVGEKQHGTLKSGAIKMKAVQDIYGMPTTSFSQGEPGVDTRPPQTPNAITLERALEAPYIEVVAAMTRAEFEALPPETGFAMAVAAAPAGELDFTLMVDSGAGYADQGTGHWCATATVNEDASRIAIAFTLANGKLLDQVTVGMAALWDDEIVRVDAIDAGAGTLTLGRGCGDTTPQLHAAGSRIYFHDVGLGYDLTEYADGETIDVKLLSRTGSQLLAIGSATPLAITFDQRLARPYPPAKLRINGAADPAYLLGALTVGWVHRDRVLQADQVVDTEAATIGPEAGTTYTMRTYVDGVLDDTQTGITGNSATVTPSADGTVRIEIEAERDSLASWQANVREFDWTAVEADPFELQNGAVLQTQAGDTIYLQS